MRFSRVFASGTLCFLLTASASAQISTAQLAGKVTDEGGAVLPGASITVTQTDTGAERTVVSDDEGGYLVSNLSPGPYRLEVALGIPHLRANRHRAAGRGDADDQRLTRARRSRRDGDRRGGRADRRRPERRRQ